MILHGRPHRHHQNRLGRAADCMAHSQVPVERRGLETLGFHSWYGGDDNNNAASLIDRVGRCVMKYCRVSV
jgi:hypothetical protein